jgi:hypothetical protein
MPTPSPDDRPNGRRDVGREIDSATPDPDVARRAARDIEQHSGGAPMQDNPVHESVFGDDDTLAEDDFLAEDSVHPGPDPRPGTRPGTAVQPEQNQPMRNVGDTEQGDRQPEGGPRR